MSACGYNTVAIHQLSIVITKLAIGTQIKGKKSDKTVTTEETKQLKVRLGSYGYINIVITILFLELW